MSRISLLSLLLLSTACAHASNEPLVRAKGEPRAGVDRLLASYQKGYGGFDRERRYLDPEKIELGIREAAAGNEVARGMVQKTLLQSIALIDPADGGAFDYSIVIPGRHPWRSPVRKKSLRTQAIHLKLYSLAHSLLGGPRFMEPARSVYDYLGRQLRADGGGFHDQDGRMATIDNGLTISALVAYHRASGDMRPLMIAVAAAERMIAERALETGGFHEGAGEMSLEASVAMAEALTALHRATADARWLEVAQSSLSAVARFPTQEGSFRRIEMNVALRAGS